MVFGLFNWPRVQRLNEADLRIDGSLGIGWCGWFVAGFFTCAVDEESNAIEVFIELNSYANGGQEKLNCSFEMGAGESLSANKWSLEVRKVKTALKITWLLLFNITEGTSFFYWILAEIQQHWYSTFSPSHSVKEKGEGRPLGKLWQGLTWECLVIYSLWATTSCHLRDCSIRGVRGNSNHIRQVPGSWIMVKTLGRWLSCITMTTHGNPCKNNWESG